MTIRLGIIVTKESPQNYFIEQAGRFKLFLGISIGVLFVVGMLTFTFCSVERSSVVKQFKASEKQRVAGHAESIRDDIRHLVLDLIMATDHVQREIISEGNEFSDLSQEFLILLNNEKKYSQLRLINADGRELIRVERSKTGSIGVSQDLQNKSRRPYFIEAIEMNIGDIYISHLDLNQEKGEYEYPFIPVLRLATPVFLDKARTNKAIVVINCLADEFLDFSESRGNDFSGQMLLANSDGYWIRGLEDSDEWGFLLGYRNNKTLDNTFPGAWSQTNDASSGQFRSAQGLFTYETISPASMLTGQLGNWTMMHTELYTKYDIGNSLEWKIISYVGSEVMDAKIAESTSTIRAFALGVSILLLWACWYFAGVVYSRKDALDRVERSEALSRSIISSATDGIIIINSHGIIQSFNKAAVELFGYQAEEVIRKKISMLMPETDARSHDEHVKQADRSIASAASGVKGFAREVQGRKSDGSFFPMDLSVSSFEVMGERLFTGIVRDITDRKAANDEMKAMALYSEHNPSALVRVDCSGNILDANPAAETWFGISRGTSSKLTDIMPELYESTIKFCIENGTSVSRSVEIAGRSYLVLLKGLAEQKIGQLYSMDITERVNAEEDALTFGRILDSSLNEIYIVDVETRKFLLINKGACENLGYTEEELLHLEPSDVVVDFEASKVPELLEQILNGSKSRITMKREHIRKDRTKYPAEVQLLVSTYDSRLVFVAMAVDITERCLAEEQKDKIEVEFRAEEDRKRCTIDSILESVSQKTGSEFFHELSRQLAEKLGVDCVLVGEFVGKKKEKVRTHSICFDGELSNDIEYSLKGTPCEVVQKTGFSSFAKGVQDQFPQDEDLVELKVEGYIGARLTSVGGKPLGLLVVTSTKEITEIEFKESVIRMFAARAASELERMQSEKQTKQLAQAVIATSNIVIISDKRGVIEYVNPAFEKITGYSQSDALGGNPKILNSGQQDKKFYKKMWGALKSKGEWRGILINHRKDGKAYTAETSISSIRDEFGELTNYISVQRDITEREENEVRMRQAQKMEAIGALAGGIAHDFNNMLMGIIGFTQIVYDELPEGSAMAEDLEEALTASGRAKDLVQQILTFSRQHETERKPIMPHLVAKEALKLLTATLPADIEVVQNVPNDCGTILGDPTHVHQIVMNLCTNAYHAMQEDGGKLSVELKVVSLADGQDLQLAGLDELSAGEYVVLSVSDTGSGMDDEVKSRIFEPFFTTKGVGKGTGMGLSTVYGIVQEYGGAITVDSKVGVGSSFKVYLPSYKGDAEVEVDESELEFKGSENILVVEDDEQALAVIQRMLQKLGYDTIGVRDPLISLEKLRENSQQFDLILTDKIMPKLSGVQFIEKVRQMGVDVPAILMTGYAESITPEVAAEMGFSALLIKPFDSIRVGQSIRRALNKSAVGAITEKV